MATLKISDLSVGDWVQDNYGSYVKVVGIWQDRNFNYQVDLHRDGVSGTIASCNIHPIPITAEILNKNGFRKNGGYNEWNIGQWDEMPFIGVSLDRQSMRVKHSGNDIFIENKVVYVHQLQRALSLANIDKEITL